MLSMAFLGVSGLRCDGAAASEVGSNRWCVQVRHGAQHCRTECVELADLSQTKHATAANPETPARRPVWNEEVEVYDREGEESVQIAVVSEVVGSRATEQREWTARINMSTFRHRPDKRTTFWVPLCPAASHGDGPFGAIEVAATYYSEDCVTQGYVYALFCGLVPLSWMDSVVLFSP